MSRAEELKAKVKALSRSYRAQAYPPELRRELVEEAAQMREDGLSWHQVGRALGVRGETLERWLASASAGSTREEAARMLPVRVVAEKQRAAAAEFAAPPTAPASPPETAGEVRIVSPSGWRVEGLSLKSAARLLKALA